MKRWLLLGIIMVLVLAGICCLFRTALEPEAFTGVWYSAEDGSAYVFQGGIIRCQEHHVPVSDDTIFSGSYSFSADSIALFAVGVEGLEQVREIYLIRSWRGDRLCENRDGSGTVYFYRNASAALSDGYQNATSAARTQPPLPEGTGGFCARCDTVFS